MTKKKLFYNTNIVCIVTLTLTMITGCVSKSKPDQIISLQKNRIHKLEKQLRKKNRLIEQLKANKWVNQRVKLDESVVLVKLKSLIKKGQWVEALQESSRLKKIYPQSKKLRYSRIKIFDKMGLKKQSMNERLFLKSLRARRVKNSLKR